MPGKIYAQPEGEGWISLEEAIKENLMPVSHKGMPYGYNTMMDLYNLEPQDPATNVFIKKIAYKKIASTTNYESKPNLVVEKVEDFNGQTFQTSDKLNIDSYLDIKINGKKINKKNIIRDDNGWNIIELNGLNKISYIGEYFESPYDYSKEGLRRRKGNHSYKDPPLTTSYYDFPLFSNIYVKLEEPSSLPSEIVALKEQRERENSIYSTPSLKGWTPAKTETLADGTIVEHYNEGVRFIKKPNGDFASFIEPEDSRDPKTLDLIKGIDKSLNNSDNIIGAYQFTFEDGVVATSDGVYDKYFLEEGMTLELNNTSNDNWNIKKKKNHMNFQYTTPFLNITYGQFIGNESIDFLIPAVYFKQNDTPILNAFKFKNEEGEFDIDLYLSGFDINDNFVKTLMYKNVISEFDPKGFKLVGISTPQFYFPTYQAITSQSNNGNIFRIDLANGDFVEYDISDRYTFENFKFTFRDGTILEQIIDKTMGMGQRVFYPDGSKFVGRLMKSPEDTDLLRWFSQDHPEFEYYQGIIYDAEGNESQYNCLDRERKNYEGNRAIAEELIKKYGESTVLEVMSGNIKVGMNINMIKEIGLPPITLDSSGQNYDWYKVTGVGQVTKLNGSTGIGYTHGYIKVDKKTNKIVYIGPKR